MSKDKIEGLPKDLPEQALMAMKESVAQEAGVPAEDVVFDGDVVRLLNGKVIGQITTTKLGGGATGVAISGKKQGKTKIQVVDAESGEVGSMEQAIELLKLQGEAMSSMAEVQIEGNKIVMEAIDDIIEMANNLKALMRKVNKQLDGLKKD